MDKLYLIGNGYVANCICENYSELFHLIGVSRSNKENCSENIKEDRGEPTIKKFINKTFFNRRF